MNKLTEAQKGYIAGLLDGEGHIGIVSSTPTRGYGSRKLMYQLRVKIYNNDYRMLEWCKDAIGYGTISERKVKNPKPNWAKRYEYSLIALKAVQVLKKVRPYLVTKGEQADLAFEFYKTMQDTKNNKFGCKGLSEDILSRRQQFKDRMIFLNSGRKRLCTSEKGCEFGEPLTGNADGNTEPSGDNISGVCRDYGQPPKGMI